MEEWVEVAALDEVTQPGSRGGQVSGLQGAPFFVVHKDGEVHAYRNACPHTRAPMEWVPDQFLDRDGGFIECALHGALFRTTDGFCLRGPCVGQSLQALPHRVEEGKIWVEVSTLRALSAAGPTTESET